MSTGHYILMLGDDDALVPFGEIKVVPGGYADVIYLSAYHYAYPNTLTSPSDILQSFVIQNL